MLQCILGILNASVHQHHQHGTAGSFTPASCNMAVIAMCWLRTGCYRLLTSGPCRSSLYASATHCCIRTHECSIPVHRIAAHPPSCSISWQDHARTPALEQLTWMRSCRCRPQFPISRSAHGWLYKRIPPFIVIMCSPSACSLLRRL
jgi:hypothetical protein